MRWSRLASAVLPLLACTMSAPLSAQPPVPSGLPFSPAVAAGDFVYLSGTLATDDAGKLVPGDVRAQTARVLDSLAALLKRSGSRMEQVAAVNVYLRHAADFAAMNEVYSRYWPKDPPARTTIIANLVLPDALVEISLVALKDGVERQVVHPAEWIRSPNPYSYAVRSKDTLFLSGLISRNGRDNSFAAGDARAQTTTIFRNAREILDAAGMSFADVVSSRVFVTEVASLNDVDAVYSQQFGNAAPARATVQCGLTGKDHLVEITLLAIRGAERQAVLPEEPGGPPPPRAGGVALRPITSAAVGAAGRLFVSGTTARSSAGQGDVAAQTRDALSRIGEALASAGFEWSDVVDAVVYLPDLSSFPAMNAAYRDRFTGPPPARATVQAGLATPGAQVQIAMTAVKGPKSYPGR